MSNVRISQLPAAPVSLTGTELVPVVQNGQTVQTTVSAIQSSPTLTQTFLTTTNQPSLANSRYLAAGTGLNLTDGGAQSTMTIALTGAPASLVSVGNGLLAKTNSTTLAARIIGASGGLSVTDGDGVGGNPTLATTGLLSALAATSGTGLLATAGGTTITPITITGVANEIDVAAGNTLPVIGLADNPVLPGVASATLPIGTTGNRPGTPVNGMLRYNTTIALFEGYINNAWTSLASGSGVTSIATGTGLTGGPITSTGTISIDSTVVTLTDAQTLTNKTISGASNTLSNIANASLTNSTISGVALGGNLFNLTAGTGVSFSAGTTYNGSAAITINATGLGGTVTSVSFTGGIISVATATTTPAFTVAGTSGGIPYFSSASTWATSAALTQYGVVYGGGAGASPASTAAGTAGYALVANSSSAPTFQQISLTAGVTGTLPVLNGGTGATNATDARTNLVAAKSGTNSDITELYALNGTSYGVAYQNASNQLIMGSALTFDGSMLFVPGGISGGTF